MNNFRTFLCAVFKRTTATVSFALLFLNLTPNASSANRVEQQKTLHAATTRLLANDVRAIQDSVIRATTVGFLAELSANLEHLRDLEEIMFVAGPDMHDLLKAKIDKLRRYDFGYGCTIIANNIDAFTLVVHEAELAASLKNSKEVIANICGNAKNP